MPPSASSQAPPRTLTLLIVTAACASALLWLLPLFTARPVLFPAGPNFADILVYKGRFTLFHTARFFSARGYSAFAYPAGAAPFYQALYSTGNATTTYVTLAFCTVLAALAGTFLFLRRHAAQKLFAPLLLLSFPLIFLIQRGNIELFLWLLVAAGIVACYRGHARLAAVLFGLAAAVKLYPIFMLGLFIKPASTRTKRDSQALLLGLATALLTMAAAISYAGPTFAIAAQGFFSGVDRFQGHYVDTVSNVEIVFDHCLFSPFKFLASTQHISPAPWRTACYLCAASIASLLFLRVHTLPLLNRLIFLTAAMVCLPPVSFTYTLVHLYLPALLLVGTLIAADRRTPASAYAALVLILFLLLPLPALTTLAALPTGPLQSCALLALLALCAVQPWRTSSQDLVTTR